MDIHAEFGKSIDSTLIERGLRELCPDIHFDLAACIGQWHPGILHRKGVYHMGKHLCGMDRGTVPEFKLWTTQEVMLRGYWWEADKEGAVIRYEIVHTSEQGYEDLKIIAGKGFDPAISFNAKGQIMRMHVLIPRKERGRIHRLGWRHTFEQLLYWKVPGITRTSLSAKFGVDMNRFLVGTPEEMTAAVIEE